jgi:hypothetical protein
MRRSRMKKSKDRRVFKKTSRNINRRNRRTALRGGRRL